MCYGSHCSFEDSMGECNVISDFKWIRDELCFSSCFIGGALSDPETNEYYEELFAQGKIKELMDKYYKYKEHKYKKLSKELGW